jgi:nucleotidyltransferase substrate binding protein (TIGR01987 family)
MNVKTEELKKAVHRLLEALAQPKNDFIRDSVIQRFEFSVELSWKTAKKVMGTPTTAPKDLIREMAQNGYVSDVDTWLRAIDMRNLSSHTYKENLAEQVYSFAKDFSPHLLRFIEKIDAK